MPIVPPRHPEATFLLTRPRLETLADRLPSVTAALVVGNGGYGKSTLLGAWRRRLVESRVASAWVVLTARDASLSAFVERLGAALKAALPELGTSAQRLIDAGISEPGVLARALVNELLVATEERAERLAIFFDDVHAIVDDAATVAFLGEFVRELPSRVHVVLASRRPLSFAPLSKLRNAGRLLEIGERDLRFTASEAGELVGDPERGSWLCVQTAGWAIAMRLGATLAAVRGASFDAQFAGVRAHAFDFLAQEVVAPLAARDREDLMALAIPAAFDEAAAAMLLGRDDAAATIERLTTRGVYLERSHAGWQFHQLFREFLLRRFRVEAPESERALRRRYSEYLRGRGETIEALGQAIEAGDFLEIVEYVHEATLAIRYSDRLPHVLDLLSRVPDAVKKQKPMLYRLHGLALQRIGRYDAATEQFAECYRAADALGDRRTKCIASLERGVASGNFRYQGHGTFAASEGFFREALAIAEAPDFDGGPGYRRIGHYLLGMALAARCAHDEAFSHLAIAERLELAEERHSDPIMIGIALAHGWRGDWRRALEYAELAEDLFRGSADFHVGFALLAQARVHYVLREDLPHAIALARDAADRLASAHEDDERAEALVVLGRCALALDPPDVETARECEASLRVALAQRNPVVRSRVDLLRGDMALATGDAAATVRHAEAAESRAKTIGDPGIVADAALLRARGLRAGGDPAGARAEFERARASYASLGDRYGATLATVHVLADDAARGTLREDDVVRAFAALDEARHEYVLAAAPEAATPVLLGALRFTATAARAGRALRAIAVDAASLEGIARDPAAATTGRIVALRLAGELDVRRGARLARDLERDPDLAVARAASELASQLPEALVAARVDVIGELRVTIGDVSFGERDPRWTRRKAADLLRYLVLAGTPVSRGNVLAALWPDAETGADVTLRVTLHALRRALEPDVDGAGTFIETNVSTIAIRRERFGPTDASRALEMLARAKLLFARDEPARARALLEDVTAAFARLPKDRAVARWLAPYVTQWRTASVEAHRTLARVADATSDFATAIASARLAHELDPLDEESVTLLLDLLAKTGASDEARLLFRSYKRRLAETIGTTPGPELVERYSRVVAGGNDVPDLGLSEREIDVLRLVARGRSNKEIGAELALSPFTINNHVARILRKLAVDNRAAAVSVASAFLESHS